MTDREQMLLFILEDVDSKAINPLQASNKINIIVEQAVKKDTAEYKEQIKARILWTGILLGAVGISIIYYLMMFFATV